VLAAFFLLAKKQSRNYFNFNFFKKKMVGASENWKAVSAACSAFKSSSSSSTIQTNNKKK